jgi:hypothetical protein
MKLKVDRVACGEVCSERGETANCQAIWWQLCLRAGSWEATQRSFRIEEQWNIGLVFRRPPRELALRNSVLRGHISRLQ